MSTEELHPYTARTRIHPDYAPYLPASTLGADRVVVAGYHAAFATEPRPDTVISVFGGLDLDTARAEHIPVMALVRLERATQVITPGADGARRIRWEQGIFGGAFAGVSWYLAPTALDGRRRCVIAVGWWSADGRQAVLPRSVIVTIPGVPTVVDIRDHDPHTGTRWTPT
ncbi:hypothetical protein ACFYV7_39195 [Nocardia suismassiliense]|uniref:Uncharacterized protein n=1 Tax=Nocardia suismassiliense TaxID=2077092 RepID=A0ABW6R7Y9_9NOCA